MLPASRGREQLTLGSQPCPAADGELSICSTTTLSTTALTATTLPATLAAFTLAAATLAAAALTAALATAALTAATLSTFTLTAALAAPLLRSALLPVTGLLPTRASGAFTAWGALAIATTRVSLLRHSTTGSFQFK